MPANTVKLSVPKISGHLSRKLSLHNNFIRGYRIALFLLNSDCSDMRWITAKGYHLAGYDESPILTAPDWDSCKQACEQLTVVDCKSFDFNHNTKACFLSRYDMHGLYLTQSVEFEYTEKCDGMCNDR